MQISFAARAALALALVAAAGCGGRSAPRDPAVPLDAPSSVAGRRCEPVTRAGALPPLDDLVRTGTRGNLALWRLLAQPGDTVELSVRYDDEGRLAWVQAMRSTAAQDRVRELSRIIRGAVDDAGRRNWGVRLRLVDGALDALEPSIICRARRSPMGTRLPPAPLGTGREMAELFASLSHAMRVDIFLGEDGRVLDVDLPHTSGSRLLDQWLVDLARDTHYDPKLHDGIGVPTMIALRVSFRRGGSSITPVIWDIEGTGW